MMPRKKTGASTLKGSKRARQVAVAILETLAGELGTTEAAAQLGVSLSRYYQLETRALAGLLAAVEPRSRGPQKTPAREIQALLVENKQLQKELRRQQALLRAAHRSVGLPSRGTKEGKKSKRVRSKRGSRGATVLQTLREQPEDKEVGDGTEDTHGKSGGDGRGEPAGA
ncbi:MAG: hypothetical protein ACYS0E_16915 [Planctomycetota bacterium]|jgi:hypothetical protein